MATFARSAPIVNEFLPIIPRRRQRRFWAHAMLFTAAVLLMNALFGERGLVDTHRARRAYAAAAQDVFRLRQENDTLRDQVRRLNEDPDAIEAVARGELGMIRRGEILVTVRDVR